MSNETNTSSLLKLYQILLGTPRSLSKMMLKCGLDEEEPSDVRFQLLKEYRLVQCEICKLWQCPDDLPLKPPYKCQECKDEQAEGSA